MKLKDLVIYGAGGLGREVLWQLNEVNNSNECQYNIMGFVDDSPELKGKLVNGFPVVGDSQWLTGYSQEICAVICTGNSKTRKNIYDRIKKNPLISFPTIIAKDVQYSPFVKFGQGCIVCLSSILTVNITIGEFVIVSPDCTIAHDSVLDDFVTLYPSVNVSGNVYIGMFTEIGTGTNIIQGKNIGANSFLGAGSVVAKDIPPYCTAVGVPATPIKIHKEF